MAYYFPSSEGRIIRYRTRGPFSSDLSRLDTLPIKHAIAPSMTRPSAAIVCIPL